MKKILSITLLSLVIGLAGCKKDSEFLTIKPTSILTNEQAFSDPNSVLSILANLYSRQLDFSSFDNGWTSFIDFGEAFPSDNNVYYVVQNSGWGPDAWGTWDYAYIRELNLFIQRDSASTGLTAGDKAIFLAEGRFLRASYYFEMVKRMGGVPLILTPLLYNFSGDPTYLQYPRAKESDVYDFVISEAEAIKNSLPVGDKSRASKGAALAMEARAALYAGSIAKYGVNTPLVSLPGGEVGISNAKNAAYYTIALRAAQEIIASGGYSLYQSGPDLADNFSKLFLDKSPANREDIWIEDYKVKSSKVHPFTVNDQPFSLGEESGNGDAGRINPSLNLVEAFENLDNTYAPLKNTVNADGTGGNIYYTNQIDIFTGRDARLAGTIMLPGSTFKGQQLDIWGGYKLADGSIFTNQDASVLKPLPGTIKPEIQVLGKDGPYSGNQFRTQSGFYIRKYIDPTPNAGSRGTGSDVAFIRYRYAEVLLNAAEAAFELGQPAVAAGYMNQVRARAGLIIPLAASDITFDRIVHERRVELAFEGHLLFDMKRWRLAHIVWDGKNMTQADLLTNIGSASKRNTQPYGLWPYKFYNPANTADPKNGKWVYDIVLPPLVTGVDFFQFGNYYSKIGDDITSANPKIVKQPNQ